MSRYYCTVKKGQVTVESETTIIDTDERVANFFEPTPESYRKAYTPDGLPFNELIPLLTAADIEALRVGSITAKATETIEAVYTPLKQRKMMSISIALQDKVINNGTLTADEEALLQANRDANIWITAIRTIENTAIINDDALDAISWNV